MTPEMSGGIAGFLVFLLAIAGTSIGDHLSRRRVRSRLGGVSVARRELAFPSVNLQFGLGIVIASLVAAVVALLIDGVGLAVLLVFAVVFVTVSIRAHRRRTRLRTYNRHLLRVLDAVVLSLRSGAGLIGGLREAGSARDGVVERDVREVVRLLDFGVNFDDALSAWTARCPLRSVRLTVACMRLAHETGGSSAHSIGAVRTTVRNAMVAEDVAQTYAAQARASATVLAALPIFLSGPMLLFNETARGFMLHSPVGLGLLLVGLTLNVVGMWWMSMLIARTAS